jgi:hypothetical protein
MFLIRGIVFSYEAARDWEAKLGYRDHAGEHAQSVTHSNGVESRYPITR